MNICRLTVLLAVASASWFLSCGEDSGASKDAKTSTTPPDKTTTDKVTDKPVDPDGTLTPEQVAANAKITGQKFWELKVHPMIEKSCKSCHADPRFPKEKDGPLTIYNYATLAAKLKDGTSVNNALLRKLTGISHEGGNRCIGGLEADPCKTMIDWYKAEFGDDGAVAEVIENPNAVSPDSGGFTRVTSMGRVFGWAVDKAKLTEKIEVKIYVDGNKDAGELAMTKTAGESGPDGNHAGDHQFSFDLPDKYRDKSVRSLYVYGIIDGQETLLAGPLAFIAYNHSAAGKTFFEQNVEPKLTACKSCHAVSYTGQFASLILPTPDNKGTKSNNELINKAGTRNGTGHGGGNRCGSASPCTEFEQWWDIEFKN